MTSRRRLLRWAHWFTTVHVGLLGLIGLPYLWLYLRLSPTAAWVYAPLAYVGHIAVLAYLPIFLLVLPLILLLPRPRVVVPLGVLLASAAASFLMLDSLVFAENRYHLGILTATLLAPQTWLFLGIYFALGVAIEGMLARAVWRRTETAPRRHVGRYLALGLVLCFAAANVMHAWFEARYDVSVTSLTRYLPLYFPLRDSRVQVRLGLVDRVAARERGVAAALGRPPAGELKYPLHPLTCSPPRRMPNVLIIVIDAMRADVLTPEYAPRLSEFARGATRFASHYSGGNSSRAGMFSIFYGVPATYWEAFAGFARPPVMMDLFRQHEYQLGIFASSSVYRIVGLDRTALARIPNLRLETQSPYPGSSGRDRTLTEEWFRWLDERDPARVPLLQRGGVQRAARQLSPHVPAARAVDPPAAPGRALPERGALRRRPGRAGARRPAPPQAARRPDRAHHLGSRHGVRRERARLLRPRHVLQRLPDALPAGAALARPAHRAHRAPDVAQRPGADSRLRALRVHQPAVRLLERPRPL
jgi:membrane-anchored protein YejM (alkaline phosphatase superfamily)